MSSGLAIIIIVVLSCYFSSRLRCVHIVLTEVEGGHWGQRPGPLDNNETTALSLTTTYPFCIAKEEGS